MSSYLEDLKQDQGDLTEILKSERDQDNSTIPSFRKMAVVDPDGFIIVWVEKDYIDTELEDMYNLIETHIGIKDVPVKFTLELRDKIDQYFESGVGNTTENHNTENQNYLNGFHAFSTLSILVFGAYVFFRGKGD